MSSFVLKIVAIITMSFDHFGYVIYKKLSYFNYIGRIAFPIFAFQISEGYIHTKNKSKYFIRLLVFALVSQIPFMLFSSTFISNVSLSLSNLFNDLFVNFISWEPIRTNFTLNIFFTLALGFLAILSYDKISSVYVKTKPAKVLCIICGLTIVALISYIGELMQVDYGYWGVLVIFFFYLFKDSKAMTLISFSLLLLLKYIPSILNSNFDTKYIFLATFTLLPIIPILLYNKKQGPKIKYFLYIFYPAHLLLFGLLTYFL